MSEVLKLIKQEHQGLGTDLVKLYKGEQPGHEFHGNQYTGGEGSNTGSSGGQLHSSQETAIAEAKQREAATGIRHGILTSSVGYEVHPQGYNPNKSFDPVQREKDTQALELYREARIASDKADKGNSKVLHVTAAKNHEAAAKQPSSKELRVYHQRQAETHKQAATKAS